MTKTLIFHSQTHCVRHTLSSSSRFSCNCSKSSSAVLKASNRSHHTLSHPSLHPPPFTLHTRLRSGLIIFFVANDATLFSILSCSIRRRRRSTCGCNSWSRACAFNQHYTAVWFILRRAWRVAWRCWRIDR